MLRVQAQPHADRGPVRPLVHVQRGPAQVLQRLQEVQEARVPAGVPGGERGVLDQV